MQHLVRVRVRARVRVRVRVRARARVRVRVRAAPRGFRLGTRPRPSRFQLGGSADHRPCSARCSGGCEISKCKVSE